MRPAAFDRSFTVGLFLTAGVAVAGILRLLYLFGLPGGPGDGVWLYHVLLAGWAVLALAPAYLRALGPRWAWRATDVCLFPLLFLFPVGTGLFIWWWLGLREKEELRLGRFF